MLAAISNIKYYNGTAICIKERIFCVFCNFLTDY